MNIRLPFRQTLAALCSLALLLMLPACDDDSNPAVPENIEVNTATYISGRADLSELESALQAADLTGTLEGSGPFTVFAPSNSAMAALNVDGLAAADGFNDVELLQKILRYHVVDGQAITAGSITDGQTVTTVQGTDLTFTVTGEGTVQLGLNGTTATVTVTDLETTNGVIHIIDNVLFGPTNTAERAKATPATETLATALGAANLESTLEGSGPFTVFAPVNGAFGSINAEALLADNALLSEVLTYHVVSGSALASGDIAEGESTVTTEEGDDLTINKTADGSVTVNGVPVTTADIQTTNGVIHLIDGVLLETLDIANYAALTPAVETLVGAVDDAGLTSELADEANTFTVFAPVNSAFDAIDTETLTGDAALLSRVLNYHVVPGQSVPLTGAGLSDGDPLPTNDTGQSLTVSVENDSITAVNGAEIAGTVEVENGTIHLLNEVLLQSANIAQRASLDPNLSALVDAATTAGLASGTGTLGDDGTDFTVFAPPNGAFSGLNTAAFTGEDGSQPLAFDIVRYHAIQGTPIAAADISDGRTAESPVGPDLEFRAFADGSVTVNGVPVTTTDLQARNGIIHLIDGVLLGSLNIAQRATVEPALSTLVTAIEEAGLTNTLATGGPFTVFAPTNEAFVAALDADGSGSVEAGELPANLADILQYHVLNGTTRAADITNGDTPRTLQGTNVTLAVDSDGSVTINPDDEAASVTITDIEVDNGVVHVIDTVLEPGDQSSGGGN